MINTRRVKSNPLNIRLFSKINEKKAQPTPKQQYWINQYRSAYTKRIFIIKQKQYAKIESDYTVATPHTSLAMNSRQVAFRQSSPLRKETSKSATPRTMHKSYNFPGGFRISSRRQNSFRIQMNDYEMLGANYYFKEIAPPKATNKFTKSTLSKESITAIIPARSRLVKTPSKSSTNSSISNQNAAISPWGE